MNEKVLKTLEYTKIIDKLAEFAGSVLGREKCKNLLPLTDIDEIRHMQEETTDALNRILQKGSLSFSGIPDIRASIKRLEVDATLGTGELLRISSVMTAALRVKNYGNSTKEKQVSHKPAWKLELEKAAEKAAGKSADSEGTTAAADNGDAEERDSLSERFSTLEPLSPMNNELQRCIISEEEIADDASAGLKHVRREIKKTNDKIHEQMGTLMTSYSSQGMLQDSLITMRDGRYCLPVKSEFRSQLQGMVHDQSSSGSTLFVEPLAVVKLNNELRELGILEQEEIEKVLKELSSMLSGAVDKLTADVKILTEFDFIFSRAALSKSMRAVEPRFNDRRYINIKKGRHPLIEQHKVVPIDIYIGDEFDLLVITGPNTGGKTVTLKTVGLFTLLGQAGLHVPAAEGTELGIFNEVYADIGDEQSIEQNLSTFSSHMTNTVHILEKADSNSLTLFDELGAGTDPTEGAALAMSILTYLHKRTIRTIATTHYSELKVFALTTKGVSNACCEFNVETLRPTYRLLVGIPGKSNAFAISSKLGLPEHIINDAREFIGVQEKSFEDLLSDLENDRVRIEREKEQAAANREETERIKQKLEEKAERIEETRSRIISEANEQARKILSDAKEYADAAIKKFNNWSSGGAGRDMELERTALREKLSDKDAQLGIKKKDKERQHLHAEYKEGDTVYVLSLNLKGKVASIPNPKGDLSVLIGSMRTQVNIKDIEPAEADEMEESKKKNNTGSGKIGASKAMTIKPELNLIGKRVDEALPELDKYLDDAYLSHLNKVTIIHGRGTGALRDAVHSHLKKTKYVSSFRVGEFGEGDRGVTIVEFKE